MKIKSISFYKNTSFKDNKKNITTDIFIDLPQDDLTEVTTFDFTDLSLSDLIHLREIIKGTIQSEER